MISRSDKDKKGTFKEEGAGRKVKSDQSKSGGWKTDKSSAGRPIKAK